MADVPVLRPLRWGDGVLALLDQTQLPGREVWLALDRTDQVADAIRSMQVRGAPAIGCAAAYGVALAARAAARGGGEVGRAVEAAAELLAATRPTAVNLFWALDRMRRACAGALVEGTSPVDLARRLEELACAIQAQDIAMCRRIGAAGAALIPDRATILTHCNAGALATGGYGTALGVVRSAREAGKQIAVIADETRPFLQGSRLTAWELARDGFEVTVIPDGAAAHLLARGEVTCVVVGADRIAANGDVANKIGTYGVALAARASGVPFYVAAPTTTVDLTTATGADIPIEERAAPELLEVRGVRVAPAGVHGRYPAFDVTPAGLITAIVTESGVAWPPLSEALLAMVRAGQAT